MKENIKIYSDTLKMKVWILFYLSFAFGCNLNSSIDKLITVEGNSVSYNSRCEIHYVRDNIILKYYNRFEGKDFNKKILYKLIGDEYYLTLNDIEENTTDKLFLSIKGDTSFTVKEYFGDTYLFKIQRISDNRFKSSFEQKGKSQYQLIIYYNEKYKISEIRSTYRDNRFVYVSNLFRSDG